MNAEGKRSPKASPILNTGSNLNGKEGSKDQRLQGGWRRQEVRHQQQCVNRLTLLQLRLRHNQSRNTATTRIHTMPK